MADTAKSHGEQGFDVDLDALSVEQLTALRDAAEAMRLQKLGEARDAVLKEARSKLAALGLTLEAAVAAKPGKAKPGKAKPPAAGPKLPVKFRGPNGEEWSGRGKLPAWVAEAEKQGKKRDDFAV